MDRNTIIAVLLLCFGVVANTHAQTWPRFVWPQLPAADSTGQFAIASSSNGTWSSNLLFQGDTLLIISGTDGVQLPYGTTTERPTGDTAILRYNTDSTKLEYYTGSAWNTVDGTAGDDGNGIYDGSGSLSGNTTVTASSNLLDISGTASLGLPSGTDAQRPTGAAGRMRHSSTSGSLEFHDGSGWNTLVKSAATGLAIDANGQIDYDINSLGTASLSSSDYVLIYDVTGAVHYKELVGDLTYSQWNLQADSGPTTAITDGLSVNFNDDPGLTVRRLSRTVYYGLDTELDSIGTNGFSYGAVSSWDKLIISQYIPSAATNHYGPTLPDPDDGEKTTTIIFQSDDDNSTYDNFITTTGGGNDFVDGGVAKDTVFAKNGEILTLNVLGHENDNTHYWAVRRSVTHDYGSASATTDGSGDITVNHNLGTSSFATTATTTGTTFYNVQVHTKTTTTFKIRFFDSGGSAVTSTAVTSDWISIIQ